jgi:hypothetical protein
MKETLSKSKAIKVSFLEDGTDYHFGSLKAIYELFSAEEIGKSYRALMEKVKYGQDFVTNKVRISIYNIYRIKRKE